MISFDTFVKKSIDTMENRLNQFFDIKYDANLLNKTFEANLK